MCSGYLLGSGDPCQRLQESGAARNSEAGPKYPTQDYLNSRHNAEQVLGLDENLFRIHWLPESKNRAFQSIASSAPTLQD
ncbi:hypothetical protein EV421DRAFT_194787 [Armillaria borealis]|uniref:Sin3 C-terminal domain-containing protein n=1 Tax=Armillaria borealis TaxID=47425 RepID=A0AA39MVF8_9AGAR|nr:hypothetical protein EV421DRAFT_194787 [Armillaria borealis]